MFLNPLVKPALRIRLITAVSACALFAFACLGIATAQDAQHTENKADQVLRASGRINPSSLGMEMSIPLGSYPGRGINIPISLNYSSKLWRMEYTSSVPKVNTSQCWQLNQAKYAENSTAGWTTSIGIPYVEYTGRDNIYDDYGAPHDSAQDICNPQGSPQKRGGSGTAILQLSC